MERRLFAMLDTITLLKQKVAALEERVTKLEKAAVPHELVGRRCNIPSHAHNPLVIVGVQDDGMLRVRGEGWGRDWTDLVVHGDDVELL